jgi:hypothetical protein
MAKKDNTTSIGFEDALISQAAHTPQIGKVIDDALEA